MVNSKVEGNRLQRWWWKRKRKWLWVAGAVLVLLFVLAGVLGNQTEPPEGSTEQTVAELPKDLVGTDVKSARARLEQMGFTVVVESVDGRTVMMESNWVVESVREEPGSSKPRAVLRVSKPAPTTSTTTPAAPTTSTLVTPANPEPEPQPEPEPGPAEAPYYASCAEARAAGAAPLHAGEPGYRQALDRDRDGVACE